MWTLWDSLCCLWQMNHSLSFSQNLERQDGGSWRGSFPTSLLCSWSPIPGSAGFQGPALVMLCLLPNDILCYFTDLLAPHGLCSSGGHLFHPGKFVPSSGKGAKMVEFGQLGKWGGAMDNCSLSYVGVLQVSDTQSRVHSVHIAGWVTAVCQPLVAKWTAQCRNHVSHCSLVTP